MLPPPLLLLIQLRTVMVLLLQRVEALM